MSFKSSKPHEIFDVFIAGAGIPGLTLALLLANAGFSIVIADPADIPPLTKIKPDGRTAALMEGSIDIVKLCGAWGDCEKLGEDLKTLRIIDDALNRHQKPMVVDFQSRDIGRTRFGRNMPLSPTRTILFENVKKSKNIIYFNSKVTSIDVDKSVVSIGIDKDVQVKSRLVIGADGRNSAVRDLCHIHAKERDYNASALTCLLNHDKDHENISTEFHRPGGPFTLVPMPKTKDGYQSALVWVDKFSVIEDAIRMDKKALLQVIQDLSRDILGTVEIAAPPQSWPLKSIKAKEITAPRTILIAEAAHVMTPLGAQGLNLSMRDVGRLYEILLNAAKTGQDIGAQSVLKEYESRRKNDTNIRMFGTHSLMLAVSNDNAAIKSLRRMGLQILDKTPALKKAIMKEGLAPDF